METSKEFIKYLKAKGVSLNYNTDNYPSAIHFPYCYITDSGVEYPISDEEIKRAEKISKHEWILFGRKPFSSVIIFGRKLKKLFTFFSKECKKQGNKKHSINYFQTMEECNDFYSTMMERIRNDVN